MSKITYIDQYTSMPIPSSRVIDNADWLDMDADVLLIGHDESGDITFATSSPDLERIIYLLEMAKHKAMESID